MDAHGRTAYETLGREAMVGVRLHDALPAALDLPRLVVDDGARPDLETVGVLGEGGMGHVDLARQVALGRDVAIKRLLDSRQSPENVDTLLREARLTGRLEHPHIIPIHWIGCAEGLGPVVVMKRVKGRSWSEALKELDRDDEAALASHVETLVRVCDAVDYAHSEGVIHRDLKPANVMLGDFGEVYVVDWGIAIELDAWEPDGRVIGTPGYMAPEMAEPFAGRIDERTDVFLLGATLYEILFGAPPHGKSGAMEALEAAREPVSVPDDTRAPEMLVSVCRRALALDPDDRHQSAAELRQALRDYFQRRSAVMLATAAEGLLAGIEAQMRAPDRDPSALLERIDGIRYQFGSALELWDENPRALDGLARLAGPAVECHLALGNLAAARQLVDRADAGVAPELIARLEARERERELEGEARAREEALRRDRSLNVGGRTRSRTMAAMAVFYVLIVVAANVHKPGNELNSPGLGFAVISVVLGGWLAILFAFRKRMTSTYVDRTARLAVTSIAVLVFVNRLLGWIGDYPNPAIVQFDVLLAAGPLMVLTTLHRRFLLLAALCIASSTVMLLEPSTSRLLINLVPGLVVLGIADLWRRLSREGADVPSADGAAREKEPTP